MVASDPFVRQAVRQARLAHGVLDRAVRANVSRLSARAAGVFQSSLHGLSNSMVLHLLARPPGIHAPVSVSLEGVNRFLQRGAACVTRLQIPVSELWVMERRLEQELVDERRLDHAANRLVVRFMFREGLEERVIVVRFHDVVGGGVEVAVVQRLNQRLDLLRACALSRRHQQSWS